MAYIQDLAQADPKGTGKPQEEVAQMSMVPTCALLPTVHVSVSMASCEGHYDQLTEEANFIQYAGTP